MYEFHLRLIVTISRRFWRTATYRPKIWKKILWPTCI